MSLVATRLRGLVQVTGLVRKETFETLRQPQLLLLLIAGPFLILLVFGFGYDEDQLAMNTRFVGPEDSIYESSVVEHAEALPAYIRFDGYSSDLVGARRDLAAGDLDLIVTFPPDTVERLLRGERAPITVLHDKLDPIQMSVVEIAAQLAVAEVNATVLETLVDRGLDGMRPVADYLADARDSAAELEQASLRGDTVAAARQHRELVIALTGAETAVAATATIIDQLGSAGAEGVEDDLAALRDEIAEARASADEYRSAADGTSIRSGQLIERVDSLTEQAETVLLVAPQVAIRPFEGFTARLADARITPTDFFAPATIALLLAHLGLTFAAMSIVSDRRLGVFEAYTVAPIGMPQIALSKYLAFVMIGGLVAAGLLAAVVLGLGVPVLGSILWIAASVVLLLVASIGLGLLVSAVARSDSQAVQYSMLLLLAGLFFGGFFLELDAFATPVQVIASFLPVTYGIALLHDLMLRGLEPEWLDLAGLGGLALVYGLGAMYLMRRELRVS